MKNSVSRSSLWGVFAILCVLNIWDAATTAILVYKFGPGIEANPILYQIIDSHGVMGLWLMKFVVVAFMGIIVSIVIRKYRKHRAEQMVRRSMWVLNALFALIVINNLILVFRTLGI